MTFNAVLELYAGKLARTVPRGPRFREETWLPNFEEQKDPASDMVVATSKLSNEILIMKMKIASLMPVRFVESLRVLKRHYDGLLSDFNESHLLHSAGDGKRLPPLYTRTSAEVASQAKRKPYRLIG